MNAESFDRPKRIYHLSETSDGSTDGSCGDFLEEADTLQEMFPLVCSIEVSISIIFDLSLQEGIFRLNTALRWRVGM